MQEQDALGNLLVAVDKGRRRNVIYLTIYILHIGASRKI
jgi:hypothetical protein